MIRILLTGGGTGGHVYPLIAVSKQLKNLAQEKNIEVDIRYFGPKSPYNDNFQKENIKTENIIGAKLRRYWSWENFVDAPKFFVSIFQALLKVRLFKPSVAFSKGGVGALSVLFACWIYKIPIIIHESDTVPGLTNKISGRWAKVIELGWEYAKKYFPNKNTQIVGVPIREEILNKINTDQEAAKKKFGFNNEQPLVLVLGGSQGSEKINNLILENLKFFLNHFQIFHQVGSNNYNKYLNSYNLYKNGLPIELQKKYRFQAFFENDMAEAYKAADLIIARSGSSIFEFALARKPSILIPLSTSANNHQKINAIEYAKSGAAIVIEENNLSGKIVLDSINKIVFDNQLKKEMGAAALMFAKPNAAKIIANDILEQ